VSRTNMDRWLKYEGHLKSLLIRTLKSRTGISTSLENGLFDDFKGESEGNSSFGNVGAERCPFISKPILIDSRFKVQ
jgi:hypothetical protein